MYLLFYEELDTFEKIASANDENNGDTQQKCSIWDGHPIQLLHELPHFHMCISKTKYTPKSLSPSITPSERIDQYSLRYNLEN